MTWAQDQFTDEENDIMQRIMTQVSDRLHDGVTTLAFSDEELVVFTKVMRVCIEDPDFAEEGKEALRYMFKKFMQ